MVKPHQHTLPAHKRLKHKKLFDELFSSGKTIKTDKILMVYKLLPSNEDGTAKAAFSVSKRKFKKAVDRNRLKRLMREAYRLNKAPFENLLKEHKIHALLIFVFIFNEPIAYTHVQEKITILLQELQAQLQKAQQNK